MNVPESRSLIPPRPNLGPESTLDSPPFVNVWTAGGILASSLLLIAVVSWILIRRVRGRPRGVVAVSGGESDNTPRGHFVALSQSIRETLTAQFGTSWRAKTTEELSADSQLEQVLGKEPLEELIRFLDQVDRLKFAPERPRHHVDSLDDELAAWKPKVTDLVEKIRAKGNGRIKSKDAENGPARPRKGRSLAKTSRAG